MIPEWMMEIRTDPCTCSPVTVSKKKSFVQRTISDVANFLINSLLSESYAKRDGFLQTLDPRVKLISIVVLIFTVSMTRDIRLLAAIYSLTLLFAYLSRIELFYFVKRVWVFIPIFTGIITIPILFNVFMPGTPLVTLIILGPAAHLGPFPLPDTIFITMQGALLAATFTLRVATCVSAAVLLFLTTRRDVLFKSLRAFRVPKVYVLTLDMCYRYIFLFSEMVKDFYLAKKSRSVRNLPLVEEQKWVGGRIGYTLVKSIDMSEKVHQAMISRGFNGEVKLMHEYTVHRRDYVALASVLAFSMILVLVAQNMIHI